MTTSSLNQPWLYSPRLDLAFIIAPAFVITLLVLWLHAYWPSFSTLPPWLWLLLIVAVDVAHVYSTLFRTYLDKQELQQRPTLYLLTPLLAWLVGFLLYSIDEMLFWRVLAYLAVFHFVRQQFGLVMLYGRGEPADFKWLDKWAIYAATIYPLIYWHTHQREFHWFVAGDFVSWSATWLADLALGLYVLILLAYLLKEIRLTRRQKHFNWPRNLMLLGTMLSWYVGIVWLNNDLAFSAINVIAHGIPYLALIWIYGRNQAALQQHQHSWYFDWLPKLFQLRYLPLYLGVLFLLGWLEESLWDGWIWQEHQAVLPLASWLNAVQDENVLPALVALLAVPQITHYVLDAFIWRMSAKDTPWAKILFHSASAKEKTKSPESQ